MLKSSSKLVTIILIAISSCSPPENSEPTNDYEKFVDGLVNLQEQAEFNFDSTIVGGNCCDFDFDTYFKYFDQLSVDSNWVLESHYRISAFRGHPVVASFARNDTIAAEIRRELSLSRKGLLKGKEDYDLSLRLFGYMDSVGFLSAIHINSDSGYFQYLIFALFGGQYCLFGDANYANWEIITSRQKLKYFTELENDTYYRFSKSVKKQALKIDPEIKMETFPDSITFRIVTLDPWTGFVENKYSITKSWPHKLTQYEHKVLVKYDCGVRF